MKLVFRTLVINDFKEYIGKHVLRLASMGLGVHFVCGVNEVDPALGSNGASKSTIFDALRWCLFGSTVKGLKNPDVRTWGGSEHAEVKLVVSVDDVKHTIIRSTKTNGLTIDDEHSSQEAVERLIALSPATFDHTLLMGQGENLFLDLGPTPKLNVLSDTLDLERWERRAAQAKNTAQRYEGEIASADVSLRIGAERLESLDKWMDLAKTKMKEWEQERSEREREREATLKRLDKELKTADADFGIWDLKYDGVETELRAARRRQQDLATERNDHAVEKIPLTAKVSELEKKIAAGKDGKCETCGQTITAKHKAHDLKRTQEDLVAARTAFKEAMTRDALLAEQCQAVRLEVNKFLDVSNEAQDRLTQATAKRARVKAEIAAMNKFEHADGERINPHVATLAEMRGDIRAVKQTMAEVENKQRVANKRLVRAQYWITGFKQVRLYLLQEALDELEALTNTLLPTVGLDGWMISYDIERETKSGKVTSGLTVSILKPSMKKPVRWESWSGGEAQRLRLVGSIALSEMLLRRSGVECDLLVLDEPTQHLSPEGVKDTADLLCDRGEFNQVFYIDHQAVQSNRFTSVLTVTKTKSGASFQC